MSGAIMEKVWGLLGVEPERDLEEENEELDDSFDDEDSSDLEESADDEIDDSSELLTMYKNTSNIEGARYELSKLWFLIDSIEKKMNKRPDSKTYNIYFLEEKIDHQQPIWDINTFKDKQQKITTWLQNKRNPSSYQKEIAEKILTEIKKLEQDAENQGGYINESLIKTRLSEIFEGDEDTLEDVALVLGEDFDYFENIESEDSQEESQENELMWCPIPIGPKNFM